MIHFSFSRNLRSLFVAAFLIFVALDSLAQYSSIININQVPMLLHPSFVGSTGGRRASAVFGLYDADGRSRDRKYYNLYYDQMWKRIGTGIGGYVNVHYRYVDGARDRRELNRYAQTRDGYVSGGIALAPKYTKLKNEREILYTWSPSISLAYGHNNIRVKTDVPYNNPDGQIPWKGSSLYHHGVFSGTLGGMLNNKVWLVGATLQYESEKQSNTTYTDYTDTAGTYYYYNNGSESYTHRFGGSVIVGLSFPKKEQSLLGISLVAKATLMPKDLNSNRYSNASRYGNINLRVWRILLGLSQSNSNLSYNHHHVKGYARSVYIGYKHKGWKGTLGLSNHRAHHDNGYGKYIVRSGNYFGEATVMYSF